MVWPRVLRKRRCRTLRETADALGDGVDGNALGGVFADELHRADDHGVVDGGGIAALAHLEEAGGDLDGLRRCGAPAHEFIEEARGFVADPFVIGFDAAEARLADFAVGHVVVDPDDADLFGDGVAEVIAGLDDVGSELIAGDHQGDRLGEVLNPRAEAGEIGVPAVGFALGVGDFAEGQGGLRIGRAVL